MDAKGFNTKTSIFRYSKNYGSLTHETGIKDAVNMKDLTCLLATVRTLNLLLHTENVHLLLVKRDAQSQRYVHLLHNKE